MGEVIQLRRSGELPGVSYSTLFEIGPNSLGQSIGVCTGVYRATGTKTIAVVVFAPEGSTDSLAVIAEYLDKHDARDCCTVMAEVAYRAMDLSPLMVPEPSLDTG